MVQTINNMEVVGDRSFALRPPTWCDAVVLAANTEKEYAIPADTNYIVFSADGDFYVDYQGSASIASTPYETNVTAAIPAGDITDGTSPELNPTVRFVGGVDDSGNRLIEDLSLIAGAATVVTIACYK